MKGNKMSAILAMLLLVMAIAAVPFGHSDVAAPATGLGSATGVSANIPIKPYQLTPPQANPNVPYPPRTSLLYVAGTNGTQNTLFWVDIDAYGVTFLSTFTVGFVYNSSMFNVIDVTNGSILNQLQPAHEIGVPGSYSTPGVVSAYGWSATDSFYFNGTGPNQAVDLMNVEFNITGNQAYQDLVAGIPLQLMGFSYSTLEIQLLLEDVWGNTFTPTPGNATATYVLPPPTAPVASSTVSSPVPTGTPVTFNAAGSTPGWTGVATAPIDEYYWTLWNSTVVTTTSPTLTVTFATPGTYSLYLVVNAKLGSYNMNSTNVDEQTVLVVTPPTGCLITLYTQNWRYIDPFYLPTTFTGDKSGIANGTEADSFRPGDLVQLFANATYNGAPVSNALVTFEVFDNAGNVVTIATATTNCYGVAEWDFRIPWPSTESLLVNNFTQGSYAPNTNMSNFGQWKVYATWQLGSQFTEQPPFEKTQAAWITFDVSWGLSVSIVSITPNPAVRGPASCGYGSDVVVKVNVMNEYLEAVSGTLFCTIYDNLLVPIYPVATLTETFPVGTSSWSFASIEIPSYAFVGTGYVVVNLLSTWPVLGGTAFCPTAIGTLVINAP